MKQLTIFIGSSNKENQRPRALKTLEDSRSKSKASVRAENPVDQDFEDVSGGEDELFVPEDGEAEDDLLSSSGSENLPDTITGQENYKRTTAMEVRWH
jgi:hypothetical protein